MARYQDIIAMSETELLHELKKTLLELHELRMSNKLRQLKETHKIRLAKRYISQIKTALQELKTINPSKENENLVSEADQTVVQKNEDTVVTKKQSNKRAVKKSTKNSN